MKLSEAEVAHVYERYAHLILRWSARYLRDPVLAEDVLHEVMLIVMDRGAVLLRLETERARCKWLRTTSARACWAAQRRRARGGWLAPPDSAAPPPAQQQGAFEERELLEAWLERLDGEERILAVLHFEDGYTKMEMKDIVRRSRPFIDKKLERIVQVLRDLREPRKAGALNVASS